MPLFDHLSVSIPYVDRADLSLAAPSAQRHPGLLSTRQGSGVSTPV
ncbi:hypothetical protein ACIPVB_05590 [Microbacterium sp. NPDC090007]